MNFDTEWYAKLDELLLDLGDAGATEGCVAGGAVRDSLLEKPIKDIDIFYTGDVDKNILLQKFSLVSEEQQIYQEMRNNAYEESGWKVSYKLLTHPLVEYPIQLIEVKENIWMHIRETFGCNLSKVAYAPSGGLFITPEFMKDYQFELLTFTKTCTSKYKDKMVEKYPDFLSVYDGYEEEKYKTWNGLAVNGVNFVDNQF